MSTNRRDFLSRSLAASTMVAMGSGTVPGFLAHSARAASQQKAGGDRVLVVVQLLGGNDGLNTVVPHGIDGYARARRALRLPTGSLVKLNDVIGLHSGLGQLGRVLEQNRLAIIQGVGYPNPDRSHFRSMEIWETARTDNGPDALATGWLGRVLDATPRPPGADLPALDVGSGLRLALKARSTEVPALESLEQYTLRPGGDPAAQRAFRTAIDDMASAQRGEDNPLLGFVRRTAMTAYASSRRLDEVRQKSDDASYPATGLGRRLKLIGQLIKAGFGTKIYYTTLDGFDTHANQLATHAALLTQLGDALAAFHDDMKADGQADRVTVLSFSEFGRRVSENASSGTDHGAAAPVFMLGPLAKAGLIGDHPSLEVEDLDDGDLKHHTDFRRIYAAVLESWLGLPASPILGEGFAPLPLFQS